jgi:hypothetical protein
MQHHMRINPNRAGMIWCVTANALSESVDQTAAPKPYSEALALSIAIIDACIAKDWQDWPEFLGFSLQPNIACLSPGGCPSRAAQTMIS